MPINMNSWLKNILWLGFFILVLVFMRLVKDSKNESIIGLPLVNVDTFEDQVFLTKEDITDKLLNKHLIGEDFSYSSVDFNEIEKYIKSLSEVKSVTVYTSIGNEWHIDVVLRRAISRLFNLNGTSCYIDKDGTLMPLSNKYSAHVININGFVNETDMNKNVFEVINNDSLKTIEIIDDLYAISNYVCSDKFFSSQITHIYVNSEKEFELIPRVGNQRILFGDIENYKGKFKKLEVFYKEGISKAGWQNYDTINVKFNNQIVCSKR